MGGDCIPNAWLEDSTGVYPKAAKLAGKIKKTFGKFFCYLIRALKMKNCENVPY